MSRPSSRLLRGWVVVIGSATVASFALHLVGLPSPVLFGSLLGAMVYALGSRPRW